MAVAPEDFLSSAEALLAETGEMAHRNAASRAYYAAFHRCRPWSEEHLPVPADARGSHSAVVEALTGAQELAIRAVGYMLKQGLELRRHADYDIDDEFRPAEARQAVAHARKIIDHEIFGGATD